MLELWEIQTTSSLTSLPGSIWLVVVATGINIYESNRTKLCTYVKLNCLKWNCFCMLNWIGWNGTSFDIETVLMLNWIVWNKTICTKMNLALNILQRLICYITQTNKPVAFSFLLFSFPLWKMSSYFLI